jgi:hypothetical protein
MTSEEKFLAFIRSTNLKLSLEGTTNIPDEKEVILSERPGGRREYTIGEGEGYTGLFSTFAFDAEGKFIDHGAWE